MVCYHGPKNVFRLWMSGFSNQNIISKLQITERVYRWLGTKKDNIFSQHTTTTCHVQVFYIQRPNYKFEPSCYKKM